MESYLVKAQLKDMNLLYRWVNDTEVRANSFNSRKISEEEHKQWFEEKLKSDTTDIYIYYLEGVAIGQVRLDYKETVAYIDYSIDRAYRGKGHGTTLLSLVEKLDNKKRIPISYIGKVKSDNLSSQKVFTKIGYDRFCHNDYIEFIKKVSDI